MQIAYVKVEGLPKLKGRSFLSKFIKEEVAKAVEETGSTEVTILQQFDYNGGKLKEGTITFAMHKLTPKFSGATGELTFEIDKKKLAKFIAVNDKKK